ncbi:MAG: hypothetical protein CMB79_05890 [Filomicrobium sp.]|nr:hypothetical protein [Filomicrobium sp.]
MLVVESNLLGLHLPFSTFGWPLRTRAKNFASERHLLPIYVSPTPVQFAFRHKQLHVAKCDLQRNQMLMH